MRLRIGLTGAVMQHSDSGRPNELPAKGGRCFSIQHNPQNCFTWESSGRAATSPDRELTCRSYWERIY